MVNLVGKRYWFFLVSLLIIVPGLISLAIPPALKVGIDFTSGSMMTMQFADPSAVSQSDLRAELTTLGHGEAVIQRSGDQWLIRTGNLDPEQRDAQGNVTQPPEQQQIQDALTERFGQQATLVEFTQVSPAIAAEVVQNATLAVVLASIGILLYITWAFRKVPRPFRYGTCAIVALLHDVLIVIGVYSILGKLFNMEVDAMFITAVLTVIGFSIHDTIVVFDRIRENMRKAGGVNFPNVVNHSLLQTMGRSISTSLTVVLTLTALLVFGGVTIRSFVLVLLIGIISGTYSSIFNASQLLVAWEQRDWDRWLTRFRGTPAIAKDPRGSVRAR
ncbi:MAG: protein translocase subunit SecF [Chloroflexota bacterium]|nr:MAG: protein translocase subunit SecF [Chloroflexota bacterium]